jgi:hypothetical protein
MTVCDESGRPFYFPSLQPSGLDARRETGFFGVEHNLREVNDAVALGPDNEVVQRPVMKCSEITRTFAGYCRGVLLYAQRRKRAMNENVNRV